MKIQMLFLSVLIICSSLDIYSMQRHERNPIVDGVAKGSIMGVAEVTVNQPLAFVKNRLQQGDSLRTLSWRNMYKGYGINAASMAPITGVQVGANAVLSQLLKDTQGKLSQTSKMLAACGAGAFSALFSCPSELVMLLQQNTGKRMLETVRSVVQAQGSSALYRGFIPTAVRDGGFTAGYLALGPIIRNHVGFNSSSEFVNSVVGGVPAGLLAAYATHPADMIKTMLQLDYQKECVKNFGAACAAIYHDGGIRSFYKGAVPRATRVTSAVILMSYLQEKLKNF